MTGFYQYFKSLPGKGNGMIFQTLYCRGNAIEKRMGWINRGGRGIMAYPCFSGSVIKRTTDFQPKDSPPGITRSWPLEPGSFLPLVLRPNITLNKQWGCGPGSSSERNYLLGVPSDRSSGAAPEERHIIESYFWNNPLGLGIKTFDFFF